MNKPMFINILGTPYKFIYQTVKEDEELLSCRAYTDFSKKEIHINSDWFKFAKEGYKTFRHELIHCFVYESGLWNNCVWADNEEMTDWIALQLPKIAECFETLNILKD